MDQNINKEGLTGPEFTRLANNYYNSKGLSVDYGRIVIDAEVFNHIILNQKSVKTKFKIAMVCICLNENYWPFAKEMIEGARKFFLPGHDVDFLLWSDMPPEVTYGATVFPTEPVQWPMPTLLRYHLFLQQEEKLREYDYIFYCDIDMKFVAIVGDEILGSGLTVAPHPGYVVRKEYWPPYEPNEQSASYIKRPGVVALIEGQPRFMPFYAAGGFQGGKAETFITAMKKTKEIIDIDMNNNYIPIWNDETAWNKYIFDIQTKEELAMTVFLTPSYIYPDSLIEEYYKKIWGRDYPPKLVTITKKFSASKEAGAQMMKTLQNL